MIQLWTAYATWANGLNEEVDVEAHTASEAKRIATRILEEGYDEGWTIRSITQASGVMVVSL